MTEVKIFTNIINLIFILFMLQFNIKKCFPEKETTFVFPEFDYKETSKNELSFREFESSCELSKNCEVLTGAEKTRCVRQCISPSCYQDIYQFDELEEGEIDVRLNSFKGCFVQRSAKATRI